jgi:hypothetical protein
MVDAFLVESMRLKLSQVNLQSTSVAVKEEARFDGLTLREWTVLNAYRLTRLHLAARTDPVKLIGFVAAFGLGCEALGALWNIEGERIQVAAVLECCRAFECDAVRRGGDAHRLRAFEQTLAFIDAANTEQAKIFCASQGNRYWEFQHLAA